MAKGDLLCKAKARNELKENALAKGELLCKDTARNKWQEDKLSKAKGKVLRDATARNEIQD